MNFFKMIIEVFDWKKKRSNDKPLILEIKMSLLIKGVKVICSEKIDISFIVKLIESERECKLFNIIINNLEELKAFYMLEHSHQYIKTYATHSLTCQSFFYFLQISSICWEIQIVPFSDFILSYDFLENNFFDSIRLRLDDNDNGFFLFSEIKTGELILDFFMMYSNYFADNLNYNENVLHIQNMKSFELVKLINYFLSFWMTRTNLKLCREYVNITR